MVETVMPKLLGNMFSWISKNWFFNKNHADNLNLVSCVILAKWVFPKRFKNGFLSRGRNQLLVLKIMTSDSGLHLEH